MKLGIVSISDRLAARAATTVTRRRFLRNAGALALATSMSATLGGRVTPAIATGTASHPCGPSPLCPSAACGQYGNCDTAGTPRKRVYNTNDCAPDSGVSNCWVEDYTASGHRKWRCCDCCAYNGAGARCDVCDNVKYSCICRINCNNTSLC